MTVTLTESLRGDLRRAFVGRMADFYITKNNTPPEGFADRVYNLMMSEYLPSLSLVPEMFLTHIQSFRLDHKIKVADSDIIRHDGIELKFDKLMPWVSSTADKSGKYGGQLFGGKLTRRGYYSNDYTVGDLASWGAVGDELVAYMTQRVNDEILMEKLGDEFRKLLDQNRTLRQLLKAFPALKPFVSPYLLDRLKSEPKARVGNAKDVDLQFLTTMAVQCRLLTT